MTNSEPSTVPGAGLGLTPGTDQLQAAAAAAGAGAGGGQYPLTAPAESPPVGQQPPTVTSHLRDDLKSEIGE